MKRKRGTAAGHPWSIKMDQNILTKLYSILDLSERYALRKTDPGVGSLIGKVRDRHAGNSDS